LKAMRLRRRAAITARFERKEFRGYARILAVTEADAEAYRRILPQSSRVVAIPTIFDVAAMPPIPDPGGHRMVFVGAMVHRPNNDAMIHFIRQILPRIRAEAPDAELTVVGRDPSAELLALAGPDVRIIGPVSAIHPFLEEAAISIAPLRFGSGVKVKVLEALAYGMATVTTSIGAEGIDARHGRECLIADGDEAFAAAVVDLLRKPELRAELGRAGRKMMVEKHSAEVVGPYARGVYREAIETTGKRT